MRIDLSSRVVFNWHRCADGYEPRGPAQSGGPLIVARSRASVACSPLATSTLAMEFAQLDFAPSSYCHFADRFGLLLDERLPAEWARVAERFPGDRSQLGPSMFWNQFVALQVAVRRVLKLPVSKKLDVFAALSRTLSPLRGRGRDEARLGRRIVDHLEPSGLDATTFLRLLVGHGCATMVIAQGRNLSLEVRPRNLAVAIALQALWLASGEGKLRGAEFLTCAQCQTRFVAGPGTGRRRSSRFCGDQCRYAAHYVKRSRRT